MDKRKLNVKLSPFMVFNREGELIFYSDPPCPKCDGYMGGETSGAFSCEFCGYSEIEELSSPHGYSYLLEGTWKVMRVFLPCKRLKWEVSRILYGIHSRLETIYLRGRHKLVYADGEYMWDWEGKKWVKFI